MKRSELLILFIMVSSHHLSRDLSLYRYSSIIYLHKNARTQSYYTIYNLLFHKIYYLILKITTFDNELRNQYRYENKKTFECIF